jgi:tryptophan 2,3-dioxygenase
MSQNESTYYGDYLELPKILSAQNPLSKKVGQEAHDETLFIVVHQVYELWFKQILHEIKSIVAIFKQNPLPEKDLQLVNSRLERILRIQSVLLDQISILETMTPMDFLEFRNLLYPASGFQSVQFRELEIILGLSTNNRYAIDREFFLGRLNEIDRANLEKIEKETPLIILLESWLERLPFTSGPGFNFWKEYQSAVETMLKSDRSLIEQNSTLTAKDKLFQLENHKSTEDTFKTLLSENLHSYLFCFIETSLSFIIRTNFYLTFSIWTSLLPLGATATPCLPTVC